MNFSDFVPAQPATKVSTPASNRSPGARPRSCYGSTSALHEEDLAETDLTSPYDDRAPVLLRLAGSGIDLLIVAFASSPFAAVIE